MTAIYFNSQATDDQRRARLYAGELFVYAATQGARNLCELAANLAAEAFSPYDPREAQFHLPVEEYVKRLADLKPRFIHHPDAKRFIPRILKELGCNLEETYFDVPRLRTVTHGGYLTSGLAYAFKPHRDTWYSPPSCQLNWWLPVYPIEATNAMSLHLHYWNRPIQNTSAEFNYQVWQQTGRRDAAQQVGSDTRRQSAAIEPLELEPEIRIVAEPGGLLIFSAAHLHSTVENTAGQTRFSIDFRTVHRSDLEQGRGAPNVDSACSGSTIRDYLQGRTLSLLPDSLLDRYEQQPRLRPIEKSVSHS